MKTKQAVNPYMPSWEYVPDAEPHVVGDRVYVYGSHDIFNGLNFCLGDYVCWSAPIDDLGNWRYEGCIYKREQDPAAPRIRLTNGLAAPDMVQGPDGRFYLYYFMGGTKMISVAVCDEPAGKYEFYGYVKYSDGVAIGKKNEPFQFDPGIFMDDDGKLYLYTGFALAGNPILLDGSKPTEHGPMCFELDPSDMLTVLNGPSYIGVAGEKESIGTPYEGHSFLEASSMRKFNGTYYFIYSTMNSHELCYATSDSPVKGFQYGGILVSNGDVGLEGVPDVKHARCNTGNTHGSIIELNGKYFVFYHRHSNRKQSSVIISRNLTWTLPHVRHAYQEWLRVLKKGGVLLNFDANYGITDFSNVEDLPENHAHNTLGNDMMRECEEIKRQLPISSYSRPAWDLETLGSMDLKDFRVDLGISSRIYLEKDEFYNPTPLFMLRTVK